MTHGSLFSGIGGFDLAAEWMGWENVFHCEIAEFPRKVLQHYWPNAISYEDIKQTDFTIHRGQIDILTGGFPCQPFSAAGLRKGKEDDRHLWPEYARAIREIQPRWVVGENVHGLLNWSGGLVLAEVQADLEAAGYESWVIVLPACSKGAPHKRDRVWIVAHRCSNGGQEDSQCRRKENSEDKIKPQRSYHKQPTPDTDKRTERPPGTCFRTKEERNNEYIQQGERRGATEQHCGCLSDDGPTPDTAGSRGNEDNRGRESRLVNQESKGNYWQDFPTQSPVCGGDDGLPSQLDGVTFSKWRNESIKGYGNAIVPQVAFEIFKAITQIDKP